MDNTQKIRAEIERRMKELENAPYAGPIQARVHKELNYFKKLIDSLPDEPKGWISVKDALPPMDEEVIVLDNQMQVIVLDNQMHGKKLSTARRICFGHIVDRRYAMDYGGWNIPGVEYWIPCPPIPDEPTKRGTYASCLNCTNDKGCVTCINGSMWEGVPAHLTGHPDPPGENGVNADDLFPKWPWGLLRKDRHCEYCIVNFCPGREAKKEE